MFHSPVSSNPESGKYLYAKQYDKYDEASNETFPKLHKQKCGGSKADQGW